MQVKHQDDLITDDDMHAVACVCIAFCFTVAVILFVAFWYLIRLI